MARAFDNHFVSENVTIAPTFARYRRPATTDIKDAQLRARFDLDTLRGPAITEIDSPHLRVGRRLVADLAGAGP